MDANDENAVLRQFTAYKNLADDAIEIEKVRLKEDGDSLVEADDGAHWLQATQFRMDTIWHLLSQHKYPTSKNPSLSLLAKIAAVTLLTPHSNAAIERVYSLVSKNGRDGGERNRMSNDTLSSLLAIKLDRPDTTDRHDPKNCHKFEPSTKLIGMAKRATTEYNNQH